MKRKRRISIRFIFGESEPISSTLVSKLTLRMHILALITSNFCKKRKSIFDFFYSIFFVFKYRDIYLFEEKIDKILETLNE